MSSSAGRLGSGWVFQGQPCSILTQGSMLLLINQVGSVGSGVWTSKNTFTVLGGGLDFGLTAQVSNRGRTINWSNNTVWTQGVAPRRLANLEGSWLYEGQPCCIFQQENFLLGINEVGSIGCGIVTTQNSFTVLGGNGWEVGLTTLITDRGNTINWSNNTIWTRD